MKRYTIIHFVSLALVAFFSTVPVASVVAQDAPSARVVLPTERTVLPIPEPKRPAMTTFDVSSGNGSSGDNYTNTVLDDEAAGPITDDAIKHGAKVERIVNSMR